MDRRQTGYSNRPGPGLLLALLCSLGLHTGLMTYWQAPGWAHPDAVDPLPRLNLQVSRGTAPNSPRESDPKPAPSQVSEATSRLQAPAPIPPGPPVPKAPTAERASQPRTAAKSGQRPTQQVDPPQPSLKPATEVTEIADVRPASVEQEPPQITPPPEEPRAADQGRQPEGQETGSPKARPEPTGQNPANMALQADQARQRIVLWLDEQMRQRFTYPGLARKRGFEGTVLLQLRVAGDGRIGDIRVLRSSGHGILDRNASRTLARIGRIRLDRPLLTRQVLDLTLPVIYRLSDKG